MDIKKYAVFAFIALLGLGTAYHFYVKAASDRKLTDLQNQIAERDKTIEVSKGVFERQAKDIEVLKSLSDAKDKQVSALKKQLDSAKQDLVTATTAVLKWKQAYEGLANATQTDQKDGRVRVDFKKEWSFIEAEGYTLTNPAEAYIKVQQTKPLKLTIAIARDKQGKFYAYATSSDANVDIDIQQAAIDTDKFKESWYQKIGVSLALAASGDVFGSHVGLTYRFGKVDVGPTVGYVIDSLGKASRTYGLVLTWRPFGQSN